MTNPLRPEDILLRLATATAAVTGKEFLLCLVREVAAYLDASEVFLTERHPINLMQIQTLAYWKNGQIQQSVTFSLNDAPACYEVFTQCNALQFVVNPQRQIIDPQTLTTETTATAQHYTGVPLIGNNQFAIGHLAVISKAPLPTDFIPVIQVFAARASAELDRLHAERGRQTLEDRYRHLFENSPQPILVFDVATLVYTNVNEAALRMYGYSRAEFLRMTALDLRPSSDEAAFQQTLQQIAACQEPYVGSWKHKRKDGVILEIESNCSIFETEGYKYMVSIIKDVSERQRLEEERNQAKLEERNRLARELHDSVTQTLWSAALVADVLPDLWALDEENGKRKLAQLQQLNRTALAEMRALLIELRPTSIAEASLGDLLQRLIDALLLPNGIQVILDIEHEYQMSPELKFALIRITQEALNNIIRHSEAKQVRILLCCTAQGWKLLIADNGRGFDPAVSGILGSGHMGIQNMQERARQIGATLTLQSTSDNGTEISLVWQE